MVLVIFTVIVVPAIRSTPRLLLHTESSSGEFLSVSRREMEQKVGEWKRAKGHRVRGEG